MSINQSVKSFIQLVGSQLFVKFFNLLTLPVILRYYIPEEYGKVALFTSVMAIIIIFLNFTDSAKSRFAREEYDKTKKMRDTFWSILLIKLPFVLLLCIATLLNQELVLEYTGVGQGVITVLLYLIIVSLFGGNLEFLHIQEKFGAASLLQLINIVFRLVAIVLLMFNIVPPVAIFLIIIHVLTLTIRDIIILITSLNKFGYPRINMSWTKEIILYSIPFLIHTVGGKTVEYIDTFVIKEYMDFKSVGIYSVAYKIFMFMYIPLQMLSTLLKPRIISLYIHENMDKLQWFYKNIATQVNFFIYQVFTLGIICLPALIIIVGDDYKEALVPLSILMTSFIWLPMTYLTVSLFHASKIVMPHIIATVSAAVMNLALDFLLIPIIGIMGGAIATTLSFMIESIIQLTIFKRLFKVKLLHNALFGFSLYILCALYILQINYTYLIIIYLALTLISWISARKHKLFSTESIDFFEKAGFPKVVLNIIKPFYIKYLVIKNEK